ncbi:MAG: hypothetical protein IKN37_04835, partial [Bacteroidales bacterium]|nr:hypothetical protein [Bacteroidales bacterium]
RDGVCDGSIPNHPGRPMACLWRLRGAKSFIIGIYRAFVPAGTWGVRCYSYRYATPIGVRGGRGAFPSYKYGSPDGDVL